MKYTTITTIKMFLRTMLTLPASRLVAVSVVVLSVGCSTTVTRNHPATPQPISELPEVGYSYFTYDGESYQLRAEIERDEPVLRSEHDAYDFRHRGRASVWRFNPESQAYDLQVSDYEPISTRSNVMEMSDGKLYYNGGRTVKVGRRMSGLDDRPMSLHLRVLPVGIDRSDSITLSVLLTAKIVDKTRKITYSEAEASRRWQVNSDKTLASGMQVSG